MGSQRYRITVVLCLTAIIVGLSSGTVPAQSPGDKEKAAPLSGDELTLLKLASTWHCVNGKRVSGDAATFTRHADIIVAQASKPDDAGKLGRLVLAYDMLTAAKTEQSIDRLKLYAELPGKVFELAIDGAVAGLKGDDLPTFAEFRRGPGKKTEEWLDNLRANEISRWEAMVVTAQAGVALADTFEKQYADRLSRRSLGWESMTVTALNRDQYGTGVGKFVELTYKGDASLTNVVFVSRLRTIGPVTALAPGQLAIMAANELGGDGDKNKAVGRLFKLHNCVHSMPKGGIVYVPSLKSGDKVQLVLGNADAEFLLGASVAVYSDQGRTTEKTVDYGKPKTTTPATPTKPETPATPEDASKDKEGRSKFNGKLFKFFPEVLTWKEAKARCEKLGGHLAVVTDSDENKFLTKLVLDAGKQEGWLGATDEKEEGKWVWVNDAEFKYMNWARTQPNNKGAGEHSLMLWAIQNGTWCDQPNKALAPHAPGFICQWKDDPKK